MSVSVFLGGFGFGNLGDEACLATAYNLYKSSVNCVFTHDRAITSKVASFDFYFNDIKDLLSRYQLINRVIIAGGGVGFMPSFKDNLDWALRCKNCGAEVLVHNIGIGKIGSEWSREWPYLVPVLSEAREFSVRDFRSKAEVQSWGLPLNPSLSSYPERYHRIDYNLADRLPNDYRYIGISITNRRELWDVIKDNLEALSTALEAYKHHYVLPIISTIHALDPSEHDNVGFIEFAKIFELKDRVVFSDVCEYEFWRRNIGPGDVKYLISRCDFLFSARKHNIIHAIGCRVPFLGIFEFDNDSIPRVCHALRQYLPPNSSLMPLYPL